MTRFVISVCASRNFELVPGIGSVIFFEEARPLGVTVTPDYGELVQLGPGVSSNPIEWTFGGNVSD